MAIAKVSIYFAVIVLLLCFLGGNAEEIDVGTRKCFCPITANIAYVCGSNGVTYSNPSALRCAAKCTKTDITIAHDGRCK